LGFQYDYLLNKENTGEAFPKDAEGKSKTLAQQLFFILIYYIKKYPFNLIS
jgi:hypothetical protein